MDQLKLTDYEVHPETPGKPCKGCAFNTIDDICIQDHMSRFITNVFKTHPQSDGNCKGLIAKLKTNE